MNPTELVLVVIVVILFIVCCILTTKAIFWEERHDQMRRNNEMMKIDLAYFKTMEEHHKTYSDADKAKIKDMAHGITKLREQVKKCEIDLAVSRGCSDQLRTEKEEVIQLMAKLGWEPRRGDH